MPLAVLRAQADKVENTPSFHVECHLPKQGCQKASPFIFIYYLLKLGVTTVFDQL